MKIFLCMIGLCAVQLATSQRITFQHTLGDSALVLGRSYTLPDGTPVTIERFRFYIGQVHFYRAGHVVAKEAGYHLVDAEDTATCRVDLPFRASPMDSISFLLGVDSVTNVSGAFGGDLDPVHGMYWAWNSGYINLKLEGRSPVSPYPTRTFELHLGGYLPPHSTAQRIALPCDAGKSCRIRVDVVPLLQAADPRTRCNVMSPGMQAVRLSQVATTMFTPDATP